MKSQYVGHKNIHISIKHGKDHFCRLELQQFRFPAGGRSDGCRTGKMTISSVVGGREETMQDICGHKEGMEGGKNRKILKFF